MDHLLGPDWLASEKLTGSYILLGDFNSPPSQAAYKKLADVSVDALRSVTGVKAPKTWPSSVPILRIDHVFVPLSTKVLSANVPWTRLTQISSDHLPVIVDLEIKALLRS